MATGERRTEPSSFIGTGWSFPPSFGEEGGEVAMVSELEDIEQSLLILLTTRPGERPMQESFGCDLHDAMFEEINQALHNRIRAAIHDAILRHEPRIALHEVDVTRDEGDASLLHVRLDYSVRETNSRYNMVFPFHLNEARAPLV